MAKRNNNEAKASSNNTKIANGLKEAATIKNERDFLISNLNKDCIGKVFRGVERMPNGELRICWDADKDPKAQPIYGTFHSDWNGHDIGVRGGCDAAGLLWSFLSLASHEEFDEFVGELAAYKHRASVLGEALLNECSCDCCCEESEEVEDDECPQEVRDNCPQDCESCPEDLKHICDLSIDRDEKMIEIKKEYESLLEEKIGLLDEQNNLLRERTHVLEKAIKELSKRV